jgi:hypothetical protein
VAAAYFDQKVSINYKKHYRNVDKGEGIKKARGSRNPRHGKENHYIVHKPSRLNTKEHNKLPRNAENLTFGGDKRRLTRRARKHGDAHGQLLDTIHPKHFEICIDSKTLKKLFKHTEISETLSVVRRTTAELQFLCAAHLLRANTLFCLSLCSVSVFCILSIVLKKYNE